MRMTVWGLPRDLLRPGSRALFPCRRLLNGTLTRPMLLMKPLEGDPTHAHGCASPHTELKDPTPALPLHYPPKDPEEIRERAAAKE